jgi:ABC-type lipoprotein release transport system permease subunit
MGWINKQRNIIDFALSSLLRRKTRNVSLLVVYTGIVFLISSIVFSAESIEREACILLENSPEMIVQRNIAGRHDLIPAEYIERIKAIRGVQEVRGRLWGYYFEPGVQANYTLIVPDDFAYEPGYAVIGNGVSRTLGAGKDDLLPFRTYNGSYIGLEIADVLAPDSEIVSSDLILLSESDFRELTGLTKGYYSDLVLEVRNVRELPTIADKIRRILPDTRPISRDEILRTYEAIFEWRGGILLAIVATAAFAFVIFAWDKATGLSSEEKKEIGILKGIGWETSDVLLMKSWEGLIISLTAFSLGITGAYYHVYLFSAQLFEPVLKGWSVLYPEFRLIPFLDMFQIVTIFFLTVVPYTVATVIPAWRAATTDPDSVMRL